MEIFIRIHTECVELFFNIFTSGIETFVTPWDQLLYPVSYKFSVWDCNHSDIHFRCSIILKTLMLTGQEFREM